MPQIEQQHAHRQHEHAVAQRKINQEPDHAALFLYCAGKLQRIGHDLVARLHIRSITCWYPSFSCGPSCTATRRNWLPPAGTKTQSLSCK